MTENDKLWKDIPDDSKNTIKQRYNELTSTHTANSLYDISKRDNQIELLEDMFGKHNLVSPNYVKTWEDAVSYHAAKYNEDLNERINDMRKGFYQEISDCEEYVIITYKIAMILKYGYDGIRSFKDIENTKNDIWNIRGRRLYDTELKLFYYRISFIPSQTEVDFLSFKTKEEATEFFKNNQELVKQFLRLNYESNCQYTK